LGRFKLKNVGRPFELYAVSADGIVVPDRSALEGKGERFASLPSNLPDPAAPLVGRAADLASLVELARQHRVVTITGPGGVGKTRIVIELGRSLAAEFLDGVAFVALADVADPAQFLSALADALDVKEAEERTLRDGIAALIGDKKALLLLDNFEQVVSAAADVAGLIERCPELRIVTTSRTPLRIAAEREYPLAPLALPPVSHLGRLAPGARARCRPAQTPVSGSSTRASRSRPPGAHVRSTRYSRAAADTSRNDRLEPLAPRAAGAAPVPSHVRLLWRVHLRGRRGRLRRTRRVRPRRAGVTR
jgi:hypothetical protein